MRYVTAFVMLLATNGAVAADWPSATLAKEHRATLSDFQERGVTNPVSRENMAIWAWEIATRTSPVDNRPYLMALAVDLHNSLPAAPQGRWYAPGEDMPPKVATKESIGAWLFRKQGVFESEWRGAVVANNPVNKEKTYLYHYLREKVEFDAPEAGPSIAANEIDLANPTHYQPMQQWMAKQATAMTEGIPPWEAEAWTRRNVENLPDPTPASTTQPTATTVPAESSVTAPTTEAAPAHQDEPPPEPTKKSPEHSESRASWWPWAVVAVVIGAVVLFALKRRK